MNVSQKLFELKKVQSSNKYADRIVSELLYMNSVAVAGGEVDVAVIDAVATNLLKAVENKGAILADDMEKAEAALMPFVDAAKKYTAHVLSHAHIDMNWKWGYQETVAVTLETFRTMLYLMNEYPEFKFAQSQASVYRIVEQYDPEMLKEIKQRVHEGRWEVTASTWTEADKNMPSGESQVRHNLYTKRYLAELLDIPEDSMLLDFEPDTFGHSINVPETLANAGVKYYFHMRGCDYRYFYNWRAPSGKTLLVCQSPKSYNGVMEPKLIYDYPIFCAKVCEGGIFDFPVCLGCGDHGGGPTRRDIERLLEMAKWPLFPNIKFSRWHDFFGTLEQYRDKLPTYEGEINFVFSGCYTTQARVKMSNRLAEARLYDVEQLDSAARVLCCVPASPKAYAEAWKKVLFAQFHDILPGSCMIEAREHCLGQFQEALAITNTRTNAALHALADSIDTTSIEFDKDISNTTSEGGGAGWHVDAAHSFMISAVERGRGSVRVYHLFNTTQYDRSESIELSLFDYAYDLDNVEVVNAQTGERTAWQWLEKDKNFWAHRLGRILIHAEVPAFGYATYILRQKKEFDAARIGFAFHNPARQDHMGDEQMVMENKFVKVVFDPITCAISSYIDKKSGKELISADRPAGVVRYVKENPRYGMTSWRVGQYMDVVNLNEECEVRIIDFRRDSFRTRLNYEIKYLQSTVNVNAWLDQDAARVDFDLNVDWHEIGTRETGIPQFNFYVPVGYECKNYRYDVPQGDLIRPELPHDVPATSYIEMLDAADVNSAHLMLVTDTKYGYRGNENAGAVTLVRNSFDPDPLPESGRYLIRAAIAVAEDAESARRVSACFNHPYIFTCGLNHTGTLPLSAGLLAVKTGDVTVTAVKPAEDGGIVVRVKDNTGKAQKISIEFAKAPKSAYLTDTIERQRQPLCVVGNAVELPVDAYSLAAVLVKFD